jgi:hypothetical protein
MSHAQLDSQLRLIGLSPAEIVGFKDMMNAAVKHRRDHWEKKDQEDREVWILEMAELVHECGLLRVYAGMRKAWLRNSFLPSAAEVWEFLPPVPDVIKPRVVHDPNCADCSGSGWKDAARRGERRVMRCDCNTRPRRPYKVADAEDAAWIKQKVAELDALFRMGAARTPYAPKPAAPCKEEPAAIVAAKKLPSREIRELIPVLVLTREQMDSRRALERAEIVAEASKAS